MASKKKKKFVQTEFRTFFDIKWKYISGERCLYNCPDEGVTRMEATTEDEAREQWLIRNNYAGRKFKILSVTEVTNTTPNHETRPRRSNRIDFGEYDELPDF